AHALSRFQLDRAAAHRRAAAGARIAQLFAQTRPGATWDADANLPPIISRPQAARIAEIVARSVSAGASVRAGGTLAAVPGDGAYFLPTLIDGVTSANPAVREEVF